MLEVSTIRYIAGSLAILCFGLLLLRRIKEWGYDDVLERVLMLLFVVTTATAIVAPVARVVQTIFTNVIRVTNESSKQPSP